MWKHIKKSVIENGVR